MPMPIKPDGWGLQASFQCVFDVVELVVYCIFATAIFFEPFRSIQIYVSTDAQARVKHWSFFWQLSRLPPCSP